MDFYKKDGGYNGACEIYKAYLIERARSLEKGLEGRASLTI
jgi:hypothetical protein